MAPRTLDERASALREWDTPALSNASARVGLRPNNVGFTDGSVARVAGPVFAGVAVTATIVAANPGDDAVPIADLYRAVINADGPPVVVVQDLDDPAGRGALLGEVIGTLLSALGVEAFVTNGRVRDIGDLRRLGFAVHAAGLCVSRSYVRVTSVGEPVTVAGLAVSNGDVLHGDEHGILSIPRDYADRLPELAAKIREEEQATVRWAASPEFTHEGLLNRKPVKH